MPNPERVRIIHELLDAQSDAFAALRKSNSAMGKSNEAIGEAIEAHDEAIQAAIRANTAALELLNSYE